MLQTLWRCKGKNIPLILLDSFRWLVLTPGWSSASADILHR